MNRPPLTTAAWRGFLGRCPNCGRSRLLAGYLKQVEQCTTCGEAFGHLRSDDAAPWLTILLVGHLLMPIVLAVESTQDWPGWVSKTVWPLVALVMCLAILPRARTLFLSIIWATKAPGSERD